MFCQSQECVYFTPCLQLCLLPVQKFYGYVEQTESWLSSKEAFLANEDLGVGAPSNDNFIRYWFGERGDVKYDDVLLLSFSIFLLLKLLLCLIDDLVSCFLPEYFK